MWVERHLDISLIGKHFVHLSKDDGEVWMLTSLVSSPLSNPVPLLQALVTMYVLELICVLVLEHVS